MRFEINKEQKTITLLDEFSFSELDELKKFIGDDYASYKIKVSAIEKIIEREKYITIYPATINPYPVFPNPLTPVDPPIYPPVWCGSNNNGNTILIETDTMKDFPLALSKLSTIVS